MLSIEDSNRRIRQNTLTIGTNECEDLINAYKLVDVETGEIVFEGDIDTCIDIGFLLKKYANLPLWCWRGDI